MNNNGYIINIGDFTTNNVTYPNRCLSASFGGVGIESEIIPWANTENNPWDYKYEDEEFVLDKIEIIVPTPEPTQLDVIEAQLAYMAMMTNTLIGG